MKKIIIIFISFIVGAIAAHAEDKVTIQTNVADDRKSADIVVSLTNTTEFVAFQIDITFPAAGEWSSTAPVITSRLQNASTETVDGEAANFKTITNWTGNTLRIVGYNLGDKPINLTSGEIFTVSVSNTAVVAWGTPKSETVFVEKTNLGELAYTAVPANVLVTTNGVNWATFAPAEDVTVPADENVKVHYVATTNDDKTVVTTTILDERTPLKRGEGVLVKTTEPNTLVSFPTSDEAASPISGNLLVGVLEDTDMSGKRGAYIFTKVGDEIGFYACDSGTLAAGKCYLDLSSFSSAPQFIVLYDGGATGMSGLTIDGLTNGDCPYNLQGQKVGADYKGIVIKNGKKSIIK